MMERTNQINCLLNHASTTSLQGQLSTLCPKVFAFGTFVISCYNSRSRNKYHRDAK